MRLLILSKNSLNPKRDRSACSLHRLSEPFGILPVKVQNVASNLIAEAVDPRINGSYLFGPEVHRKCEIWRRIVISGFQCLDQRIEKHLLTLGEW